MSENNNIVYHVKLFLSIHNNILIAMMIMAKHSLFDVTIHSISDYTLELLYRYKNAVYTNWTYYYAYHYNTFIRINFILIRDQ